MIFVSVVEDNPEDIDTFRQYLSQYQDEHGSEFQISYYQNGADFLEHYQTDTDIVFMDIEMPVMNGMETAHALRKLDSQVVLVFVTSLAQYAIQGYMVRALDYVVKPVSYAHFSVKMNRILQNLPMRDDWHIIPTKDGNIRIAYSRIYYVESNNHQIIFHTAEGTFQYRATLQSIEQAMRGHGFSRPNNSFLVNLFHVQAVRNDCLTIRGIEMSIGRSRRNSFLNDFSAYLGGSPLI